MRTWERKRFRIKGHENSSSMGAYGKLSTSEWKQKDSVGHQNLAKEYWVLTREFPNLLYTVNTLVAICLNNN